MLLNLCNNRETNSMNTIQFPTLSSQELHHGCKLMIDSGVDTYCAVKHAWVTEFIQSIIISYISFRNPLPVVNNLHLANVIYAYDCPERREQILLNLNHCIYMGSKKGDALIYPNQLCSFEIKIDERPSIYFLNESDVQ